MSSPSGGNPSSGGEMPQNQGGAMPPSSDANGAMPTSNQQANQGQPNPRQGWTPAQYEEALAVARGEAIQSRKKLDEIEAAKTAAERAKMDEATRAKAELEDAKKQIEAVRVHARKNALEAAVAVKAGPLGIVYPDLALSAIKEQITYGDDDKPQNVDELLRAFVQSHPGMTSAANVSRNTSVGNAPRPQQGTQVITQAQLKDYTFHEQWKKDHAGQTLGEAMQRGQVHLEK